MTPQIFLNGRFLSQPITGVQRFSAEITAAIDRLSAAGEWPPTNLLLPRSGHLPPAVSYRRLRMTEVGHTRGHLWEQVELPRAASAGVLVSLGNTAPVLAGKRQVVVIHDAGVFDTPESYSSRFRAWYKLLQHGLVRTGAQIVTVSAFSRARIAARLGIDVSQLPVIYEGADHILRVPRDPATLQRHALHPGKYSLVVGNRVAHKNLEQLRHAAPVLRQHGMVLAVAGDVDRHVYRDVQGHGAPEHRLGRVTDAELRVLYENAACLLFSSRYEGFGLPPVEAMACNCPVIAGRSGAVEEICADAALYFDHGNGQSMAEALRHLLDNDGLAGQLRARGQARVAGLSWDASARALGDVVQAIRQPAQWNGQVATRRVRRGMA